MRIAITGGTGFIGRNVARLLEAGGHEPVVLSRRTGADLSDVGSLTAAVSGCQAVIDCAGINRELGAQTYAAVHVQGTRNVLEAAKRAGARKIVFMSFLRARPGCGSPYHESKWAAEELIRASGLDYTIVKAGIVYGRGDHMLDHLSHALHTFPVFGLIGWKDQPMRPTAVEELTRVLAAAAAEGRLPRKTVAVVGPEELTLKAAVTRVGEAIGRVPWFFRMPASAHRLLASVFETLMTVPLIAAAQVRILSESLVEPAGPCEPLPDDLRPRLGFTPEQIREGLPAPGSFGLRDLRFFSH
jgi:NADH dehydrogenase